MARLSFKPDSSFFSKIAAGAVGARAVCADLSSRGHEMHELERGSTTIKLWKEVKRKRVRIPDLVCVHCGLRVESRAKKEPQLSLSHSNTDAERAWDFGFVDDDLIAFPVAVAVDERAWHDGRLESWSYWHERTWMKWEVQGAINYVPVRSFRSTAHRKAATKGVTEGSENFLIWAAVFSTRKGTVESVVGRGVKIRRSSDNHAYTWQIPEGQTIFVVVGETVDDNQAMAGSVSPSTGTELRCTGHLPDGHITKLLQSKERTQRFTGVKLARLLGDRSHADSIRELTQDPEEDIYIRLEGLSYLVSVLSESAADLFAPYLSGTDEQNQLEAVIAVGEAKTDAAVEALCSLLEDPENPYFMRAAAAWSLSQIGGEPAAQRLVQAFADVDRDVRDDALQAVVAIGGPALPVLMEGLREREDIAAGCAEALRRQQSALDGAAVERLAAELRGDPTRWAVWLAGNLPRDRVAAAVAPLRDEKPELHYAITVLWGFIESWIASYWDYNQAAIPPAR